MNSSSASNQDNSNDDSDMPHHRQSSGHEWKLPSGTSFFNEEGVDLDDFFETKTYIKLRI